MNAEIVDNQAQSMQEALHDSLSEGCQKLHIAVAFISKAGYEAIVSGAEFCKDRPIIVTSDQAEVHDLAALEQLRNVADVRIYGNNRRFHPKFYLIQKFDGVELFSGSSNLTGGGFERNLEFNLHLKLEMDDDLINQIDSFWQDCFDNSVPITDKIMTALQDVRKELPDIPSETSDEIKEAQKRLRNLLTKAKEIKKEILVDEKGYISFNDADQFFKQHHFHAFTPEKWGSEHQTHRRERETVGEKLFELEGMLWPKIAPQNWDLHRHSQTAHFVSSRQPSPVTPVIDGMWIHYGKSYHQLRAFSSGRSASNIQGVDHAFYHHTRLQVYLNSNHVSVSLMFATPDGIVDRDYMRQRLVRNSDKDETLAQFHRLVSTLQPYGFCLYTVFKGEDEGIQVDIDQNLTPQDLLDFWLKDRRKHYTLIAKNYEPDDPQISTANIVDEMFEKIRLLYPLYDFTAYRM